MGINAVFEILFVLHIMVKLHLKFNDLRSLATLKSSKKKPYISKGGNGFGDIWFLSRYLLLEVFIQLCIFYC